MRSIIVLIALLFSDIIFCQGLTSDERDLSSQHKYTGYQSVVFSAGAGITKVFDLESGYSDQKNILFLFSLNSAVHIKNQFYAGLGLDIYKEPKNPSAILYGLTLTPSLRLNYGKNTTSLWLSAGGVVNFGDGKSDVISAGTVFSVKYQYNMDKNISAGIEMKIPMIMTYNLGYRVLLLNLYISGGIY